MIDRGTLNAEVKAGRESGRNQSNFLQGALFMKATITVLFVLLTLVSTSSAKELPAAPSAVMSGAGAPIELAPAGFVASKPQFKAPETKIVDLKFTSLAVISTGSTFADSYTTLFARQNWLAGKQGVCNVEVQSAYLYGTHPTVGRAYAVASAKSVGSILAAYYLRKHHNRFWSAPLIANTVISLQGTTQNMRACN